MLTPPWDDGFELQSDYQLVEYLRTVDPEAVALDRRLIHTPTPAELRHDSHRSAELWLLSHVSRIAASKRPHDEADASDWRTAPERES